MAKVRPIDGNAVIRDLKQMKYELQSEKARELVIKKHRVYDAAIETLAHAIRALEIQPTLGQSTRLVETGVKEVYCSWGKCAECGADNMIDSKYCHGCGRKIELIE